jgi:hypothetical protein
MTRYQFRILGSADSMIALRMVDCDGEADAVHKAGVLLKSYRAIEVWSRDRRIARLGRPFDADDRGPRV